MELRDVIVTPLLIILVYGVAYRLRPLLTDDATRRYYFPALTVRIFGALMLGFIYQFYYGGGDTFNFHTHGSRHVWEAFMDSPDKGLKLLFFNGGDEVGIYQYSSKIPFLRDKSSYVIIRLASVFDLFTFSSYSATAICFSVISFMGGWLMFKAFYADRPALHFPIAIATLFIPSLFFWGSGLMKDTITLAGLGISTYAARRLFIEKRFSLMMLVALLVSFYMIFLIKKYVLLCFLPALIVWIYARQVSQIRSVMVKIMMFPFLVAISLGSGYFAAEQVGKDDSRYSLNQLGETAKVTAYDIAYQTGRDAGSTYSLGELDGSTSSLLRLMPQAINVSLFRPYLWEVRNPLMLISSAESTAMLLLTLYILYQGRRRLGQLLVNPDVVFCLVFSLSFAFGVGVATFNFGTLARYKIPLLPFYALALIFLYHQVKSDNTDAVLERTE